MALSDLFSPTSLSGIAQRLGLEPAHKDRPAFSYGTGYGKHGAVDARLTGILSEAAERFARENPGYTVEATSGKKARSSGTQWHPGGIATDVQIMDPTGKKLGNYQDAKSFRTYEKFAQTAKAVQHETYPELDSHFAWGGYYGGRFAADQMHFDLGPTRGSLGSWSTGLNKAGRSFLPGAESIGIDTISSQPLADIPTPTARPDPLDPANMAPDTAFGSLGPMFGSMQARPTMAAPLGQVDRAALPDLPASSQPARMAFDAIAAGAPASLPPDRQMPSGPVVAPQSWSPQQAIGDLVGKVTGPASLPPDRQMPSGPINVSTDFAPPTASPPRPDNLNYAGPKGLFSVAPNALSPNVMGPPSSFNAPAPAFASPPRDVASPTISPTTGDPASSVVSPTGAFPEAPPGPSTFSKIKDVASPITKNAMLGLQLGGPLGAIAAPALGLIGDKLGIGFSHLGAGFDNAVQDRFSTGFGTAGILGAMGGPKGAQGFSLSNPGMSYTSLGTGMGLRRSDKFGWTETVDPSGRVVGIKYDDPDKKGIFGKISNSMNGKFGGGLSEKGSKAIAGGKGGLY